MKKNARKRQQRKIDEIKRDTGIEDAQLLGKMLEIHYRANLIRRRAYRVVDMASNHEERAILETELCRAMALRAGERKLMYRPYRGESISNPFYGY